MADALPHIFKRGLDPEGGKNTVFFPAATKTEHFSNGVCSKSPVGIPADAASPSLQFIKAVVPQNINRNEYIPVFVLTINSPDLFWFQLRTGDTAKEWEAFEKDIGDFYDFHAGSKYVMHDSDIAIGSTCVIRHTKDRKWYRAIIKAIPHIKSVNVSFVDYGRRENVPRSNVYYVRNKYHDYPAQAFKAQLACLQPAKRAKTWDARAVQRFIQFCECPFLMAHIDQIDEDTFSVDLCNVSGELDVHIGDTLIKEGFAEFRLENFHKSYLERELIKENEEASKINSKLLEEIKFLKNELSKSKKECNALEKANRVQMEEAMKDFGIICEENDKTVKELQDIENKLKSEVKSLENALKLSTADLKKAEKKSEELVKHIEELTSEMDSKNLLTEMQNVQEQLAYYRKIAEDMEQQNAALRLKIKSYSEKILSLESQLCEIKECKESVSSGSNEHTQNEAREITSVAERFNVKGKLVVSPQIQLDCFIAKQRQESKRFIKQVDVCEEHRIHVINLEDKLYMACGELSRLLWKDEDSSVLIMRLKFKEVNLPFIKISKESNVSLFKQCICYKIPEYEKLKPSNSSLILYPLGSALKVLNVFGYPFSGPRLVIKNEILSFDPSDPVWNEFSYEEFAYFSDTGKFEEELNKLCLYDLKAKNEALQIQKLKLLRINNDSTFEEIKNIDSMKKVIEMRMKKIEDICSQYSRLF